MRIVVGCLVGLLVACVMSMPISVPAIEKSFNASRTAQAIHRSIHKPGEKVVMACQHFTFVSRRCSGFVLYASIPFVQWIPLGLLGGVIAHIVARKRSRPPITPHQSKHGAG